MRPSITRFCPAGDPTKEATYIGIGKVIDQWEAVEFELARWFTSIMGQPEGALVQFYGRERIFSQRLDVLKIAIDHHFIAAPDQNQEALVDHTLTELTWCADRRNEIAHSVVYDVSDYERIALHFVDRTDRAHFVALPPYHTLRKFQPDGPLYSYASPEMETLSIYMFEVQIQIRRFRHALYPDLWPTEVRA